MESNVFDKVYPVVEADGVFLVKEAPESHLKPKFMARNPTNGELFLLLGNHGSYSLPKGNLEKGLRLCVAYGSHIFEDCFVFYFEQDRKFGGITDPDAHLSRKPIL